MNFINEVKDRSPEAISFAAGEPYLWFLDAEDAPLHWPQHYRGYPCDERGHDHDPARNTLHQYDKTMRAIHELIERNLAVNEEFHVQDESIVVTAGSQEALIFALRTLCPDERDVVLAVTPTYLGLTCAARLVGLSVRPVRGGRDGIDLADLVEQVRAARAEGLRPRGCYVIPNFANSTGFSMDLATRYGLLELADREDLWVLEDDPFGLLTEVPARLPTLKRLDTSGRVVRLGSFADGGSQGGRVGFVVLDQTVQAKDDMISVSADELAKIKSEFTANTPPAALASAAEKRLTRDGSRAYAGTREIEASRRNLRTVLMGLNKRFPVSGESSVSWTVPDGGFFVVLSVPFTVDDALLERSAAEFGVLWTPIHHFYDNGGSCHQLGLSCGAAEETDIEEGLDRLASLITNTVTERPDDQRSRLHPNVLGRLITDEYLTLADDSCVALLPHVLRIAVEFDIADRLAAGPADVTALADEIPADADALHRLLRALASVGLADELSTGRFALTTAGYSLRSADPLSVRESVVQLDSYQAWIMADETFRTGQPVSLGGGQGGSGFFDHKDENPAARRSFIRRMWERAARCYAEVVSMIDWTGSEVVLDVGGSDGFLLGLVLSHAPHTECVLFDRPAVIDLVEDSGRIDKRIQLEAGDFFKEIPSGADTHLMCSVLHDWDDDMAGAILAHSRSSLAPGGRLLIVEMLRPDGNTWHPSKWSDLGMLVLSGGRERSESEFCELLSRHGYCISSVRSVPGSYFSLIEARPDAAGAS